TTAARRPGRDPGADRSLAGAPATAGRGADRWDGAGAGDRRGGPGAGAHRSAAHAGAQRSRPGAARSPAALRSTAAGADVLRQSAGGWPMSGLTDSAAHAAIIAACR